MKTLKFIFLWLLPQLSFAIACHPKIDNRVPQYIIGYGSLMDEHSKKETDATAQESIPVIIRGYVRSWSVYGTLPGLNTTFLSVSKKKHASLNGVIYLLKNPENIQHYDAREKSYCRKELTPGEINLYSGALPNQKQMWIYSSARKQHQYPTKDHPIVQSYVDIFIRGCIQVEEKFKINGFAKNCIKSTEQWSNHWVNDRIFPRRPWLYEPYASKIDALFKETLPEQFKHIKFES